MEKAAVGWDGVSALPDGGLTIVPGHGTWGFAGIYRFNLDCSPLPLIRSLEISGLFSTGYRRDAAADL